MKLRPLFMALTFLLVGQTSNAYISNSEKVEFNKPINDVYSLLQFQSKMANVSDSKREKLIGQDIRYKNIYDHARSIAIRASMSTSLNNFDDVIQSKARELDAIYNFQPLMIADRVVPPVITEARNLYNQLGKDQIRLSTAVFNIDKQAYFSSNPPNWRNYLKFRNEGAAFERFSYLGGDLSPKDVNEQRIWEQATLEGWDIGNREANKVIEQGMQRLNKDYIGMIRFHQLVLEGKITMPSVSNYNLYDTNSGDRLVVDEQLLRIDVLPTFKNTMGANKFKQLGERPVPAVLTPAQTDADTTPLIERPTDQAIRANESIHNDKPIAKDNMVASMPISITPNPVSIKPLIPENKDSLGKRMEEARKFQSSYQDGTLGEVIIIDKTRTLQNAISNKEIPSYKKASVSKKAQSKSKTSKSKSSLKHKR